MNATTSLRNWIRTAEAEPVLEKVGKILRFTDDNKHDWWRPDNYPFHFPQDKNEFKDELSGTVIEKQSILFIQHFKKEIERMINVSDLESNTKKQFYRYLNTHYNNMAKLVFCFSIVMLALAYDHFNNFGISSSMYIFLGVLAALNYQVFNHPELSKHLPDDEGAACSIEDFQAWIENLDKLIEKVEESQKINQSGVRHTCRIS